MTRPMPEPPPILDGETWEDYVRRCRNLGETIRQAEARLLDAGAAHCGCFVEPCCCWRSVILTMVGAVAPRDHVREV